MSRVLHPIPERHKSPFPNEPRGQIGIAVAILAAMTLALALMGRTAVCPCGTVVVWQDRLVPAENSQQLADWYSLLHAVFGMGLYGAIRFLRPHWSLAPIILAVIFGHSIWEVVENTPIAIALFSGATNAPHYAGDSILNSFGDTAFAIGGALAMPFLSPIAAAAVVIGVEVAVTWGVGDGFVVGTLRILGVPV